ncbi:hypothetical protein K443DRAFT_104986, partial [Laccaria amethystina LaAM-08-1]
ILPLSTTGWHPPSLNEWLASSLSQQTASILPLSTNSWRPSSLNNGLILPLADGPFCLEEQLSPLASRQMVPSLGGWPHKQTPPSLDKPSPPSLSKQPPCCLDGQSHPSTNALLPWHSGKAPCQTLQLDEYTTKALMPFLTTMIPHRQHGSGVASIVFRCFWLR